MGRSIVRERIFKERERLRTVYWMHVNALSSLAEYKELVILG